MLHGISVLRGKSGKPPEPLKIGGCLGIAFAQPAIQYLHQTAEADQFIRLPMEEQVLIETNGMRVSRNEEGVSAIRRQESLERSLENACLVANVCESLRGKETVVLDVTQITPLFDFFVITTGGSRRQLRAIADTADDVLAERGSLRMGREGAEEPWICHDYGDIVLHVFSPEARKQYDLENLWGDAARVDWPALLETMSVTPAG